MQPSALKCIAALFVPGDRPDRFAKATRSGADLVILDLEDAVAPANKDLARRNVADALSRGSSAFVRINALASEEGSRDLAALTNAQPAGVMIAKTATSQDVSTVTDRFPNALVVPLIESVAGMMNIHQIAKSAYVAAIAFGAFDLCAEVGARPTPEVLAVWRSSIVLAARSAGCSAIDAPYLGLDDETGLATDAERAVNFGFDGKLCIHPRHVSLVQAAFVPRPDELRRALGILETAQGGGVAVFEGTMVDGPVLRAARRVVERATSRPTCRPIEALGPINVDG